MFNTKQSAITFSKYVSDPSKCVAQTVVVQMFIFISGLSRSSTVRCLLLWFNVLLMKVDWLSTFISKVDNLLNWLGDSWPLCQDLYQYQTGSARESKGRPVTKVTTPVAYYSTFKNGWKPAQTFCTTPQQRLPLVSTARYTPPGLLQVRNISAGKQMRW